MLLICHWTDNTLQKYLLLYATWIILFCPLHAALIVSESHLNLVLLISICILTCYQFISWSTDPAQNCAMSPAKLVYSENDVITCSADADPVATYEWFMQSTGASIQTGATLTITSAIAKGFFNVYCVASNVIRSTTQSVQCNAFGAYVSTSTTTTTTTEATTVQVARMINTYGIFCLIQFVSFHIVLQRCLFINIYHARAYKNQTAS